MGQATFSVIPGPHSARRTPATPPGVPQATPLESGYPPVSQPEVVAVVSEYRYLLDSGHSPLSHVIPPVLAFPSGSRFVLRFSALPPPHRHRVLPIFVWICLDVASSPSRMPSRFLVRIQGLSAALCTFFSVALRQPLGGIPSAVYSSLQSDTHTHTHTHVGADSPPFDDPCMIHISVQETMESCIQRPGQFLSLLTRTPSLLFVGRHLPPY